MDIHNFVTAEVVDLTSSGAGVGRIIEPLSLTGAVVFVPFTIPGERIEAKILSAKKGHFIGELTKILHPSPGRTQPKCQHFGTCPGCSLQHITYQFQCEAKKRRVTKILHHALGREIDPRFIPSPLPFGYRTHLTLSFEKRDPHLVMGFVGTESREVVDIQACELIPSWASKKLAELRNRLTSSLEILPHSFKLRMFIDHENQQIYLTLPRSAETLKETRQILSNPILKDLSTPDFIIRSLHGVTLKISPESFIQANHYLIDQLYAEGLKAVEENPDDVLIELYAGSGFYTLALAPKVSKAVAVETEKKSCDNLLQALLDLLKEAHKKGKPEPDITVVHAKAENAITDLIKDFKPTIIIANPPRSGMHEKVTKAIAKARSVRRIIIISCDPPTCARDIKRLSNAGFTPEEPVLLDCYPQTAHLEIVIALQKI